MIICSCNVLSDDEVRTALVGSDLAPRTAGQVYGCLGCSPQCGRCARTIRRIMDEALGADDFAAPHRIQGPAWREAAPGVGSTPAAWHIPGPELGPERPRLADQQERTP